MDYWSHTRADELRYVKREILKSVPKVQDTSMSDVTKYLI